MKENPIFAHPNTGTTIQAPESDRSRLEAEGWYQVTREARATQSGGKAQQKAASKTKQAA